MALYSFRPSTYVHAHCLEMFPEKISFLFLSWKRMANKCKERIRFCVFVLQLLFIDFDEVIIAGSHQQFLFCWPKPDYFLSNYSQCTGFCQLMLMSLYLIYNKNVRFRFPPTSFRVSFFFSFLSLVASKYVCQFICSFHIHSAYLFCFVCQFET